MKKTLISALTTALVVGAASTTFAAANPFSDVPADHWAYDAVSQLASDGVIEGYGDSTFQGNKNITRYEMAQMIAKAMAKNDVSAADKALIDKLAAEFSDELNNLGVRVSNLERNADFVKWNGKVEATYTSLRHETGNNTDKRRSNKDNVLFRLEPSAEVNDHWHVNARLDANTEMDTDTGDEDYGDKVTLKRVWAQGDYKNFTVKLGKQELYTNEHGLLFDDNFSGASVIFGNKLKTTLLAGRLNTSTAPGKYNNLSKADIENIDVAGNLQGINLQYLADKGFDGGLGYYHLNNLNFDKYDIGYGSSDYNDDDNSKEDDANIWSANLGFRFDHKNRLWGSYANNTEADNQDTAWQIQYDYGNYVPANKGSWGAYAAYRDLGANTSLVGTYDGAQRGTKGWEIGAQYAIFKNIGFLAKYFDGNEIGDYHNDVSKIFGRIELFW